MNDPVYAIGNGACAISDPLWITRRTAPKRVLEVSWVFGAGGGGRTHMISEDRGILSPVRLPVPPLQRAKRWAVQFEYTSAGRSVTERSMWSGHSSRDA
jgi:hypothetical protein